MREDIKVWAAAHQTPDQDLCPHLVQYWRDSKGCEICWDNRTGKRWSDVSPVENVDYQKMSVKKEYYGIYVKYISELNVLELASVRLEGNRGVDGVPKDWEYGAWFLGLRRVFIVKGSTTCYDEKGIGYATSKKYVNESVTDLLHNMTSTMSCKKAGQEILAFMGTLSKDMQEKFKNNHYYVPYYVMRWYETEFMERKASSRTAFLLDYELSEDVKIQQVGDVSNYLVFEKLDDQYAVIRMFSINRIGHYDSAIHDYVTTEIKFEERIRCFISAKGKPTTVHKYSDRDWELNSSVWYIQNYKTILVNPEEFSTWTPLKYIMPVLENPTLTQIIQMLRHPVVEQIAKAGCPKVAKRISRGNEIANNLKQLYGVEKEKKLPLFKLLGVNKWLMSKEEELCENGGFGYGYNSFISSVKELYGRFDISDLSKETIELLAKAYKVTTFREIVGRYERWRYDSLRSFSEAEREEVLKACRREVKHNGWLSTYKDCKNLLRVLDNAPEVELDKVDKMSDLVRIHDALVDIQIRERQEREARYNAQRAAELEKKHKKFAKENAERIAKYDYEESDCDFVVRTPRELNEIMKEGIALHHCVGGYVERHADGYTNILFLRRKNDIEHSFYTIEIKNDKLIQIHGSCNKWLGNDPEAIPFVYRYLKQLGVSFDEKILLNKGTGYGASKESLPESYLTVA